MWGSTNIASSEEESDRCVTSVDGDQHRGNTEETMSDYCATNNVSPIFLGFK